jgi:hypothetical protein
MICFVRLVSIFSYAHVIELWGIHGNDLLFKSATFCLAYFVAKKGEKNGIIVSLSI